MMFTLLLTNLGIWNAWIFMIVFILQMIIIALGDKRIMERSHVPKEAKRTIFEKYIGIFANLFWFLALFYSVFLPLLFGTTWFYLGFTIFILGVIILSAATSNFITTPFDQLIHKGIYRFSRHPMYLATVLICLGTGIATASWLFILLTLIIAVCLHYEALVEEKYCLNKYKDVYKQYMNNVPKWFGIPK